jgi:hypothetical protein
MAALKKDLIAWKELSEATGGKLELKKRFYYAMAWHLTQKGMQFQQRLRNNKRCVTKSQLGAT